MDSESDPMGEVSTMPFAPPPTPASAPPSVKRHPVDEEEGGKRTKALRVPSTNNENKGLLPLLSAKEQVNDDLISSELADFREKMLACVEHFCQYFGQTRRAEQDELRQMFLGVRQDAQLLRDVRTSTKAIPAMHVLSPSHTTSLPRAAIPPNHPEHVHFINHHLKISSCTLPLLPLHRIG
eukprot:m.120628 g.120628  ORF g.120628 m.120628 type:complete len:181 (-) comp14559_c0_seq7:43-585(-)